MQILVKKGSAANTIIAVLMFSGILAVLLISFLKMLNNSNLLTARSLTWNNALPVAEAGIEEAAAAIQLVNYGQSLSAVLQGQGWTVSGNTLTRTRQLTNAYYTVLVTSSNTAAAIGPTNPPIISCTGYVEAPLGSNYIGRTVQVTTLYNNPQVFGVLAKNNVTVSGNGSTFDSFDPTDSNLSTGGMYDPTKYDDKAHVGCDSSTSGCVSVGAASIYGDVNTLFGGSTTVGGSGVVGDEAYVNSGSNKGSIEVGHSLNTLSPTFIDAQAPFSSGATLNAGSVSGTNYQYLADSASYYFSGDMTLSGPVLIQGNAILYVTGSFNINGGGSILIAPGASLTMFVGGPNCGINGGGVINNTGLAANCSFQCLPTCTSGAFGGGATFIGTINAPEADFSLNGGTGMCGAFTANSFKLSGGMCIHYDESLGRPKKGQLYSIISWTEL